MDITTILILGTVIWLIVLPMQLIRSRRSDEISPSVRKTWRDAKNVEAAKHLSLFDYVLTSQSWVVLDTETTRLSGSAEIIEIAIISWDGTVLFNQRIKPKGRISRESTRIHGITRNALENCPTWPEVHNIVQEMLSGRCVVTYNDEFDMRVLRQTAEKWGYSFKLPRSMCAMKAYAAHRESIAPHEGGRWRKLEVAIRTEGLADQVAHNAANDAELTRRLVLKIAQDRALRYAA